MSLQPQVVYLVPEDTATLARTIFPKRTTPWIQMRDHLGMIYDDRDFAALYPHVGHPAASPHRLALAAIMQAGEHLTDVQAATAIRARIDWKYALSLPLDHPGYDASVLSEFRTRLLEGGAERLLFDTLLDLIRDLGLLKARGKQRTDSTHVLAATRNLNRLELIGETVRAALNSLAVVAPDWLLSWVPQEWFERYAERCEEYRLPDSETARQALTALIRADGYHLLSAVCAPTTPAYLRQVPAVTVLRQVWVQQFYGPASSDLWRSMEDSPPRSSEITSPYDVDARYASKRDIAWVGYKVHVSETCDADHPSILTDVTTTPSTTLDHSVTQALETTLVEQGVPPAIHLLDTGYVDIENVVVSQEAHGIAICGPLPPDTSWQARAEDGYDSSQFRVDWAAEQATCPKGQVSSGWREGKDRHGQRVVRISFPVGVCLQCPVRGQCTQATSTGRKLTVRLQAEQEALWRARREQQTAAFWEAYAARAGIEGTLSQGIRVCGLRRTRYIGEGKVHLSHLLVATALNILRVVAWMGGRVRAATRISRFAALSDAPRLSIALI
jgi:transposase